MIVTLVIIAAVACAALVFIALQRRYHAPSLDFNAVAAAPARIEAGQSGHVDIGRRIDDAHRTVEVLRAQAESRIRHEEVLEATVRRIENVFLGSAARGRAGENVLAESLRVFPPEMLETGFRVNGKIVEFGLRLSDHKVLPIDSKWPSAGLLVRCEDEDNPELRKKLVSELERETLRRVREVSTYIDARTTTAFAVAAVPDAVLALCSKVHIEAHRHGVVLMAYSMAVPYLLLLYKLNQQHSRSIDIDQMASRLADLDRQLDVLDGVLENSILRGGRMAVKGASEAQEAVSAMRRGVQALEAPLDPELARAPENVPIEFPAPLSPAHLGKVATRG